MAPHPISSVHCAPDTAAVRFVCCVLCLHFCFINTPTLAIIDPVAILLVIRANDFPIFLPAISLRILFHLCCSLALPPRELHLKQGTIWTMMWNISIEKGLIKNSRILIKKLHDRFIVVHSLDVNGQLSFLLPSPSIPHPSRTNDRLQYPLRLAYSTTFHSC